MANNYIQQLPGTLNLEMVDDNDLVFSVDWNIDITGYQFDANIIPKNSDAEIPITVDVIDASTGKMNVVITAASLLDLQPDVHKWYMNWTTPAPESLLRTVLAGVLVLRTK